MRFIILVFLAFLIFTIFFEAGNRIFQEYQYLHRDLLNLVEKALIIREGNPPRYENAGFVYAPLAIIPVLIFKNPILTSSIVSSLTLALFIRQFASRLGIYEVIGLIMLIFNPLTVFLATQKFAFLVFYILFTLSVYYAVKHISEGFSLHAFASGMLLGMLFFVDFRAILAIPFFLLGIWLSTMHKEQAYIIAITIVKLTPIIFFFLMWMYINWVFVKDPLHFIKSPYSVFAGDITSIRISIPELLIYSFAVGITYIFVLFLMLKKSETLGFYLLPLLIFYSTPAIILTLSIKMDIFIPYMNLGIFLGFFGFVFWVWLGSPRPVVYISLSTLSLLISIFLAIKIGEDNEKFFTRALLGLKVDNRLNIKEEIEAARAVINVGCKKILTDDNFTYGVVYFHGRPKKFVLPYNYEFFSYLSFPKYHVDCLLLDRTQKRDLVLRRFPKASVGFVSDYYLAFEGERYMLYARMGVENAK